MKKRSYTKRKERAYRKFEWPVALGNIQKGKKFYIPNVTEYKGIVFQSNGTVIRDAIWAIDVSEVNKDVFPRLSLWFPSSLLVYPVEP